MKATVRTPDEVNNLIAKATVTPDDITLITKLMADTISDLLLRVSRFFWKWNERHFRIAIGYHVTEKKVVFLAHRNHDKSRVNTSYGYDGPFRMRNLLLKWIDTSEACNNVEESDVKFEEYWGEGNEHRSEFRVTGGKEYVLRNEGVETRGDFEDSWDAFEQFIEEKLRKLPKEDIYAEDAKYMKLPREETVSELEYDLVYKGVEPRNEYEKQLLRRGKEEDEESRKPPKKEEDFQTLLWRLEKESRKLSDKDIAGEDVKRRKLSEEDTADEDKRVSHNNSLYAFDKRIDAFWNLPEEDTFDEDEQTGAHP